MSEWYTIDSLYVSFSAEKCSQLSRENLIDWYFQLIIWCFWVNDMWFDVYDASRSEWSWIETWFRWNCFKYKDFKRNCEKDADHLSARASSFEVTTICEILSRNYQECDWDPWLQAHKYNLRSYSLQFYGERWVISIK